MTARSSFRLALLLLLALVGRTGAAHAPDQSYIFVRVYDDHLEARLEITAADLDTALGLGLYDDEVLTEAEAQANLAMIRAYAEGKFQMSVDGEQLPFAFTGFEIVDLKQYDFILLKYSVEDMTAIPDAIDVEYDVILDESPGHVNMLVVEHNWKTGTFNNEANVSLVFTSSDRRQTLDLSSSSVLNGFWGLIKLGAHHIWIGLDHILFLLALALPSVLKLENGKWVPVQSFRPAFMTILGVVTSFTIAHSITLTLAALGVVRLPSALVEAIIAGSIIVAALYNLYPKIPVREWAIALGFGLFHGFGFASVMGDIGMVGERMALSVLGFNIGVELGQLAILVVLFPILYLIRNARWYVPVVVRIGSMLLIGLAAIWLIERITGFAIYARIRSIPGRLF